MVFCCCCSNKVILSHATRLYLDHPYEPDSDEPGLYWAVRSISTRKVFEYMIPLDEKYFKVSPTVKNELCRTLAVSDCNQVTSADNIIGWLHFNDNLCTKKNDTWQLINDNLFTNHSDTRQFSSVGMTILRNVCDKPLISWDLLSFVKLTLKINWIIRNFFE